MARWVCADSRPTAATNTLSALANFSCSSHAFIGSSDKRRMIEKLISCATAHVLQYLCGLLACVDLAQALALLLGHRRGHIQPINLAQQPAGIDPPVW